MKRSFCEVRILVLLAMISLLALSCDRPRTGHPELGVTRRFPIPAAGRLARAKPYDFSKLANGCGLYVFSYEITSKSPNQRDSKTATGIRIWEHDFNKESSKAHWQPQLEIETLDTITILGLMPVGREIRELEWKMFDDEYQPNFTEMLTKPMVRVPAPIFFGGAAIFQVISTFSGHTGPRFQMRFQKGKIVYGGRVMLNAVTSKLVADVRDRFYEDMEPIKKRFASSMDGIDIVSDFMDLPPPEPLDSTASNPANRKRIEWE